MSHTSNTATVTVTARALRTAAVAGTALVATVLPAGAAVAGPAREPAGHAVAAAVATSTTTPAVPCFMGRQSWNTDLVGPPPVCHVAL